MIGILDLIYFPFLNKYIKRHIHSFIVLKHHLLDSVHQSLTRFYSSSYLKLITPDNVTKIYKIAYSQIMDYNYLNIIKDNNFQIVKELKKLLSSYLLYKKKHPLHYYLCKLWQSDCLVKYNDLFIESAMNTINSIYKKEYDKYTLHCILASAEYASM
jgi:hypothetical protein